MPEQTDEDLLALAGRSEAAFMKLFERHREAIFRVAYRLTNSVVAAEDIAQECFLGYSLHPGGSIQLKARCAPIFTAWSETSPGNYRSATEDRFARRF